MNNSVLGLLTNVLATSLLFATLVDSAFAAQLDESDNNQLSVAEFPQTGIPSNLDKVTESTEFVNFKSVADQNLGQFQEPQPKLTLNTKASSESFGQEVSSPEAEVVFSDKSVSENETDRATLSEYPAAENNFVLAQESVVANNCCVTKPDLEEVKEVQRQLRDIQKIKFDSFYSSPGMSIYIPVGYGADRNTGFVGFDFQERTRFTNSEDGQMVFGVGLGDARKSIGVVLSYTMVNLKSDGPNDFGMGGFNVKVHRQLNKDLAVAVGMNGFLNIGDDTRIPGANDFENSLYGAVTKVIHTREDINKPFSRVAITAGVGNGQFRTEDSINQDDDNFNVFGNMAIRVLPQASLITEWTGQDLAIGASIAPFKNIPLVITPAVRDITGPGRGASDGARFVLGAGFGFKF